MVGGDLSGRSRSAWSIPERETPIPEGRGRGNTGPRARGVHEENS